MSRNKEWKDDVLNKNFLDRLNEVVLTIGNQSWTRQEVIDHLKVGNFKAVSILNTVVNKFYKSVKSPAELARHTDVATLFQIKGVGVTTVYVFMCVLDAVNRDALRWLDRTGNTVKLGTYKARTKQEQQNGKANRRGTSETGS